MGCSLYGAQSSDVPSVGLTVRLVLVLMHATGEQVTLASKEISTFFHVRIIPATFESWLKG
ncbi:MULTISPECIES: hypothetical protein [Pseudomonas]|uniref:hypothetical protein n=1 Tax=Pseudomonas TaxID=286 RepID=UPI001241D96F|nr:MULTISPECIES: hypothetical protein [Pseudomonas]WNZ81738.1 hypothetical protein QOM10_15640 [Pseudomonas sp. P108]